MTKPLAVASLLAFVACSDPSLELDSARSLLTSEERAQRMLRIREAAAARGLHNGLLLAGIAENETNLAHCWSEATWACQGPASADCDGGPVIAGAGDGPCELLEGGLGMFQFDAGTHEDTLMREGERVLSLAGNVEAAVDFVVGMLIRSVHVDVDTEQEAIAWANEVRPYNALFEPWIRTVVEYYNGCRPGCSVYQQRTAAYRNAAIDVFLELGAEEWYGRSPLCGAVPSTGAVLDDAGACFAAGGDPTFWRSEPVGFDGALLWTHATDSVEAANYAFWDFELTDAGTYALAVYTDAGFAESRQAAYELEHNAGAERITLDQTAVDGFAELGKWALDAGWYRLRMGDNTGEPNDTETAVVADALRIEPAAPNPQDPGEALPPMGPMTPDAVDPSDPSGGDNLGPPDGVPDGGPSDGPYAQDDHSSEVGPREIGGSSGCSAQPTSGGVGHAMAWWLPLIVGLWARRRA